MTMTPGEFALLMVGLVAIAGLAAFVFVCVRLESIERRLPHRHIQGRTQPRGKGGKWIKG